VSREEEARAVALDPRNDAWANGKSPYLSFADDVMGLVMIALLGAAAGAMAWANAATGSRAGLALSAGVGLLFAGAAVMLSVDARERLRLSRGRRVLGRVSSVALSTTTKGRALIHIEVEFESPDTGARLRSSIGGEIGVFRHPERGAPVWIAFVDDGCCEAI